MSDSLNRKLTTYPNQATYNKVKALAEKQGTTVSKIVQRALNDFKDLNPLHVVKGQR